MSDKIPSSFKIEAALAALRRAQEAIADDSLEGDEAGLLTELERSTDDAKDILGNILRGAVYSGDMAMVAATREAAIKCRKERYLERERILRQVALELAPLLGLERHDFGDLSFSIAQGREGVTITDLQALPSEYKMISTTVTPNKRAILDDIKQGVVVEGAALRNPPPHIVIRTK